ncbi:peptidase [Luteimonas sp. R10]|uniref:peptidase n=1 Tax=Luteimonas sp. R10 TaxID=3108176 RepID=UPI00388EBED7
MAALLLAACASSASDPGGMPLPGSDRDGHGCIPSAGYTWCARTQQCERPWELAAAEGFPADQASFERHCAQDPESAGPE